MPVPEPCGRLVLLGASNVARGISVIVETARRLWGRPLEIFGAYGHGRSYSRTTMVLARQISGILPCGLWPALAARVSASPVELRTTALVTDIGNDLLYDEPVDKIVAWVDETLTRLDALGAQSIVTRLPLENLIGMSAGRFLLLRNLFFPKCRLSFDTIVRRAIELDQRLPEMIARHRAIGVAQRRAWYGFDAVHILSAQMPLAWREVLSSAETAGEMPPLAHSAFGRALYLRSVFPERRKVFGVEQRARQPAGKLRDGSTLWLY